MKTFTLAAFIAFTATALAMSPRGIDINSDQPNINWPNLKAAGLQYAYIRATYGYGNMDTTFSSHWTGATNAGLIRGAYHLAEPAVAPGALQAAFFWSHGGYWVTGGKTLPGAVYFNGTCSGLTQGAMVEWIKEFSAQYHAAARRYPVICTSASWWASCTGNSPAFIATNPLWISLFLGTYYGNPLPPNWLNFTMWQYAPSGPWPGHQNWFNGDTSALTAFASG